jgi:hypothetical protein
MDFLTVIPALMTFATSNWDTVVLVALASRTAFEMVKKSQFKALWPLALEVVKQVAQKQIEGPEKRKKAVDLLMELSPPLVKRVISREEMELLVEEAYLFLRGELSK